MKIHFTTSVGNQTPAFESSLYLLL